MESSIPVCTCGSFLLSVGGLGNQGDGFFRGKRFLCLKCGSLFANAPRLQPSRQESEARVSALETEFMTNCGSKLFAIGILWFGCDRCDRNEDHIHHASQDDWNRLNDALKWLSDRTGKEFGMVNGDLGHYAEMMSAAQSATDPSGIADLLRGGI